MNLGECSNESVGGRAPIVPEIDVAEEAGRLLVELPALWDGMTVKERHGLLTRMLDGVYVDMRESRSVVSIKVKPAFAAVLRTALDLTETVDGVAG